jgi:hypothetical protein
LALFCLGALAFVACSPAAPVRQFTKGDEVAYYDFSEGGTFEEGTYGDGTARLQIRDGKYDITLLEGDSELWYGQWGESFGDVVVDVEARQTTESQNTVYGVICRARGVVGQVAADDPTLEALAAENAEGLPLIASADQTAEATTEETVEPESEATAEATADAEATDESDEEAEATVEATAAADEEATSEPESAATDEATAEADSATLPNANNGDGYLFLVEGSGRFAIMRSRGRSVTPLVNWTSNSVINTGPADNRIRAVCLGDYLAMYVNGTFVGDATDDTYTSGQVGLVGAAASNLGLQVTFDNLTVSAAQTG